MPAPYTYSEFLLFLSRINQFHAFKFAAFTVQHIHLERKLILIDDSGDCFHFAFAARHNIIPQPGFGFDFSCTFQGPG